MIQDLTNLIDIPGGSRICHVSSAPLADATGKSFSSSLKRMTIHLTSAASDTTHIPTNSGRNTHESTHGQTHIPTNSGRNTHESTHGQRIDGLVAEANSGVHLAGSRALELVVKCMPDPTHWISLNSQTTFEKEFNMFTRMIPVYNQIINQLSTCDSKGKHSESEMKSPGVSLFPEFYGGRVNKEKETCTVDENAMILLENLKNKGYENCRRSKLDAPHFKLVLQKIALFHVAGLIIRHDPHYSDAFLNLLKTGKSFFFGAQDKNISQVNAERRLRFMSLVKKFGFADSVIEKLSEVLLKTDLKTLDRSISPYYTLIHNDLWINNIMFKYTGGEVTDLKFIDFQNTNYGSIAKEIAFLLYTSVDHSLWKDLSIYLHHYHDCLVKYLKFYINKNPELDFTTHVYSIEMLKEELKEYASHKLKHIFILMRTLTQDDHLYETNLKQILEQCIEQTFI